MSGAPVSEGRGVRRLPLRHPSRHPFPEGRQALQHPRRRLLRRPELPGHRPRRRLGGRFSDLRDHAHAQPEDPERRAGRAVAPHRRRDGRLTIGRRWTSSRIASTRLEKADLRQAGSEAGPPDSRREAAGRRSAPHRHAAARRRRRAWRAATSSTSAPRCRSASATSTITSSASPTMC